MKKQQEMLVEFHKAAGLPCPAKPEIPDLAQQKLRLSLHMEEAVNELHWAFQDRDIVRVADAIGDALYVVLGTAVTCGIDIQPCFEAIHKSNMTKFIDGYRREDGKWMKGQSYTPVDLEPILQAQMK